VAPYNAWRYNAGAIQSFADRGSEDLFDRVSSKAARRACPESPWAVARRKLDQLNAAVSLRSLAVPPGNALEALRGDRDGQHSIRINQQYRICFRWTDAGPERVEVTDYH
jgi:proteic killer suppression protein